MSSLRVARTDQTWFAELPNRLQEAVDAYDFENKSDFQPLADLSAQTELGGVVTYGESAIIDEGMWMAPSTVYVNLVYESGSDDQVEFGDSYPATVIFSVGTGDSRQIEIIGIRPDVSSFYGDEVAPTDDMRPAKRA